MNLIIHHFPLAEIAMQNQTIPNDSQIYSAFPDRKKVVPQVALSPHIVCKNGRFYFGKN